MASRILVQVEVAMTSEYELVDDSCMGLIELSRATNSFVRALHTPSLASYLGQESGLIEYRDTFVRFHGDGWTVILHHGAEQ